MFPGPDEGSEDGSGLRLKCSFHTMGQKKAKLIYLQKMIRGNSLGPHFTDSTSSFMSLSVSLTPCVVVLVVLLPCLVVDCALVFSSSTLDSLDMGILTLKGI